MNKLSLLLFFLCVLSLALAQRPTVDSLNNLLSGAQNDTARMKLYYDLGRAYQSQLIQSKKMASLGELTAGIAHEIQNPLNFVNNFSEVSNELIDETLEEVEAVKKRHALSQQQDSSQEKESLTEITDPLGDVKSNLENRLIDHKKGSVHSTMHRLPMKLIYWEGCLNQQDATRREKYLKSGNGKIYLKNRLRYYLNNPTG